MKSDKKEETIVTQAYNMSIQTTQVLESDWSMGEEVSLFYKPMQGR
jgi:hypothetical protein